MSPRLRAARDLGHAGSEVSFSTLRVSFKLSAEKQAELEALLAAQQNPASPDHHKWLTPEAYATRFGASEADVSEVTNWLKTQGMRNISVARGRNAVSFNGSVKQVETAFATEIHHYTVNGEAHFANATEPSVPSTLENRIAAVHGLHDFRMRAPRPRYTSPTTGNHYIAPDDFATIFNVKPLYGAAITGAGQTVAVVGQTQVPLSDLQLFRSSFNLPPKDPQVVLVPNTRDPGVSSGDLGEALLDIDWVGAVAREANIVYVYSNDVTDALFYVIDENLAPVVSMSYGLCEPEFELSDANLLRAYAQRAAAQGISWVAASGDAGAADCFDNTAVANLSVDLPASIPEVTGIGGTTLDEGTGTYWNPQNDDSKASALSYIPEKAWNDSARGSLSASGGGLSSFFAKPSWQTGSGVPADEVRAVPDVSLPASAAHAGYLMYQDGRLFVVGGTSVGAPAFAGILALLNQYQVANGIQPVAGMGNVNTRLYGIATRAPNAFHDITVGDNIVDPCPSRATTCTEAKIGYSAGVGYDLVTGLGTPDAFALVSNWGARSTAATISLTSDLGSVPQSGAAILTVTVATSDGGVPAGGVSFYSGSTFLDTETLTGGSATFVLPAWRFELGPVRLTAKYNGDANYAPIASSTLNLSVTEPASMVVRAAVNAASFQSGAAPGMILAVFGNLMTESTQSAPSVPLPTTLGGVTATINGIACPLYYVSPTQINLQVPYSNFPSSATLRISYNGQSVVRTIPITAAAPGIFMDPSVPSVSVPVPDKTAARGQTITLYVTGEGAVSPSVIAGSVPPAGITPRARQALSLTVGGAPASLPYVGVPSWSIGVTQVNYTIPATAPLGPTPVIVSVGGIPSAPVILNVTQ